MNIEIIIDVSDENVKVEKWTNALENDCIDIIDGNTTIKLIHTKQELFVYSPNKDNS